MAVNTSNTILSYKTGSAYEKLVDIINYPDLGGTPTKIDTTTLSAKVMTTSINGLQESPEFTFECIYDLAEYTKIKALTGEQTLKLEFGEGGVDGVFYWKATISVVITGGTINEARKMSITVNPSTEITETEPTV